MNKPDQFFVGYLPMPKGLLRKLNLVVGGVMWVLVGAAVVFAISQPEPGTGSWDMSSAVTRSGVLVATPYPMLIEDADRGEAAKVTLLVQIGKVGAQELVGQRDRAFADVTGFAIQRDHRRIMELDVLGGEPIAESANRETIGLPEITLVGGGVQLAGEIMDSKCYLGAMKPGHGMGHRACAQLCIRGGIPPMLVVRNEDGRRAYLVLVDQQRKAIEPEAIVEHVGVPVSVTGDLYRFGDLLMLSVDPAAVRAM